MLNNLYELKNISFARSQSTLIMEPHQSNSQGAIHGGELIKIMDTAAGIVGRKHSKGLVVTARVDEIVFHNAVNIGNTITCIGQLINVGKSSMMIMVNLVIHDLKNFEQPITAVSGIFTMVHIVNGKPSVVPILMLNSVEENEIYKLGGIQYKKIMGNKER